MKKKRRSTLLFLILAAAVFLVGFGRSDSVDLLNDAKLIDLDKAIELAKPGGDPGENQDGETAGDDQTEQNPSEGGENPASGEENQGGTNPNPGADLPGTPAGYIILRIYGEEIHYQHGPADEKVEFAHAVGSLLQSDTTAETTVVLVDDFAEAHLYRTVRKIVENVRKGKNFTFQETMMEALDQQIGAAKRLGE